MPYQLKESTDSILKRLFINWGSLLVMLYKNHGLLRPLNGYVQLQHLEKAVVGASIASDLKYYFIKKNCNYPFSLQKMEEPSTSWHSTSRNEVILFKYICIIV